MVKQIIAFNNHLTVHTMSRGSERSIIPQSAGQTETDSLLQNGVELIYNLGPQRFTAPKRRHGGQKGDIIQRCPLKRRRVARERGKERGSEKNSGDSNSFTSGGAN